MITGDNRMSKYDRMTDEQLLCDYKNGNQEIMDYLMVKYKSMVRKKARAMILGKMFESEGDNKKRKERWRMV